MTFCSSDASDVCCFGAMRVDLHLLYSWWGTVVVASKPRTQAKGVVTQVRVAESTHCFAICICVQSDYYHLNVAFKCFARLLALKKRHLV